jgi:hypothetical protein
MIIRLTRPLYNFLVWVWYLGDQSVMVPGLEFGFKLKRKAIMEIQGKIKTDIVSFYKDFRHSKLSNPMCCIIFIFTCGRMPKVYERKFFGTTF